LEFFENNLGCLLFVEPNTTDLFQGKRPKFWPEHEWDMEKWLSAYESSNISETRQDSTKVTIGDQ